MADKIEMRSMHQRIKKELAACTEFWLAGGTDKINGGVFTCLDRTGAVYSTDKSLWMQGRCAWTFSHLCARYGKKDEWLRLAESCLKFACEYGINRELDGRMYFSVTRDGRPLRQRRYCFSESFFAMGCAEYYAVTGEERWLREARRYYELVYRLNNRLTDDPVSLPPKTNPETRPVRALGPLMIYLNLSEVMLRCDPERAQIYKARADDMCRDIMRYHFKPELRATLENVGENGEFRAEISDGRHINPGHAIECAWFLMNQAGRTGDAELQSRAVSMMEFAAEKGWDNEYGGLLYFSDVLGKPCESCEHDMKLWWPHNEMMIAALTAYRATGNEQHFNMFRQCFDYAMNAFSDPAYGEWYGYLRRDGKPTEPACKGTLYKGPFHLPRALILTDGLLSELTEV